VFHLGPLFLGNPFAQLPPLLILIKHIRSHDDKGVRARIVDDPIPVSTESRIERRDRTTDSEKAQRESDHTDYKAYSRDGVHKQTLVAGTRVVRDGGSTGPPCVVRPLHSSAYQAMLALRGDLGA
jgi:hypothetical protein